MKRKLLACGREFFADARNKITLPLTILCQLKAGKKVDKKTAGLAVENLEELLKLFRD